MQTIILEMNAVGLVVPPQATDSQIAGLLKRLREDRLAGHLGDHAIADIYIFSDKHFAEADTIRTLTRGAHAPGTLYPGAVPFEVAMEAVRGHYRIDLNDTGSPDKGALGFADESGVHSKSYRRIF
jgi:hypothetical protein